MSKQVLLIIFLILFSQAGAWIQQFAQIRFEWFRTHSFLVTALLGILVAFGFVEAAKMGYTLWESSWKVRLLQFSIGVIVFTFLSWFFLGEGLNTKTLVCIFLSFCIIGIQVFWK